MIGSRRHSRRQIGRFILPFIVMVCIALILVFVVVFAVKWFSGNNDLNKVRIFISSGTPYKKTWGRDDWEKAYNGQAVLDGDSVKTSNNGRAILQFVDGSQVRLDKDTEIVVTEVEDTYEAPDIFLELKTGSAWILKAKADKESTISLNTSNLIVRADGTIFAVSVSDKETVRVMQGTVYTDILSFENNKARVIDTIEVSIAQQIELGTTELNAFRNREIISVLQGLSDDFKNSDWYKWNSEEDINPTDFSKEDITLRELGESEEQDNLQANSLDTQEPEGEEQPADEGATEVLIDLPEPKFTSPQNESKITTSKVTIEGTVSDTAKEVYVTSFVGGKPDSSKLDNYVKGSGKFKFNASTSIGNLEKNKNSFEVYYTDEDGNKSPIAKLVVYYEINSDESSDESSEPLTAPKVTSYNGVSSSEVTVDQVIVVGACSKSTEKIVVNGYTLSQFKPGQTTWTYYAKESAGNLKSGVNEYSVYAVDEDGKKSDAASFTITYNKPETENPATPEN